MTTNLTIAVATGFAGLDGPAAVAGYGTGVRLEYLLVPLVFGLGAPLVAMVGTNIGAGRRARALRVAWTGAAIAGRRHRSDRHRRRALAARLADAVRRRSDDARGRLAVSAHRRSVLRLLRRRHGALLRVARRRPAGLAADRRAVATHGRHAGGWLALRLAGTIEAMFLALGVALAVFGLINAAAVALGAWFSSVVNLSRRIALAPRTRRRSRPHGAHRGGLGQVNSAGRDVAEYNLERKRTSSTSSAGLPKRRAVDTYPCDALWLGPSWPCMSLDRYTQSTLNVARHAKKSEV